MKAPLLKRFRDRGCSFEIMASIHHTIVCILLERSAYNANEILEWRCNNPNSTGPESDCVRLGAVSRNYYRFRHSGWVSETLLVRGNIGVTWMGKNRRWLSLLMVVKIIRVVADKLPRIILRDLLSILCRKTKHLYNQAWWIYFSKWNIRKSK